MSAPILSDAAADFGKRWLSINLNEGSQYSAKAIGNLLGRALTDAFEAGRAIEAKVRTLHAGQSEGVAAAVVCKGLISPVFGFDCDTNEGELLYLGGAGQSEPVAASIASPEPTAEGGGLTVSSRCPVCGYDKPHGHDQLQLHTERVMRPAFEALALKFIQGKSEAWWTVIKNPGNGYGHAPNSVGGYPASFGWNRVEQARTFGGDIVYSETHWAHRKSITSGYTNPGMQMIWEIYRGLVAFTPVPTPALASIPTDGTKDIDHE